MIPKIATLIVVSALAGVASAQSKIEDPFRVELGLYVPTFSGGHKDVGGEVGLGYSFYRKQGFDVAAVARGEFYHFSQFGDGSDFSLGTYGVDLRYRPMGEKFFVGAGLAAGESHVDADFGSGDTTKLAYSVEAGYDFSKSLYGVVRFQDLTSNDVQAYRGVTVGLGYRF